MTTRPGGLLLLAQPLGLGNSAVAVAGAAQSMGYFSAERMFHRDTEGVGSGDGTDNFDFSQLCATPTRAVVCPFLSVHACCMLIGGCNLML